MPKEKGLFAKVRDYVAEYAARQERARARGVANYYQERKAGGALVLEGKRAPPGQAPPKPPEVKPPRARDYAEENRRRQEAARGSGYSGKGERDRMYREIREGLYNHVGADGRALTPEQFKTADDLLKRCADDLVYWRSVGQDPHLTPQLKREVERKLGEFMRFPEIWAQMKAIYFGMKV